MDHENFRLRIVVQTRKEDESHHQKKSVWIEYNELSVLDG